MVGEAVGKLVVIGPVRISAFDQLDERAQPAMALRAPPPAEELYQTWRRPGKRKGKN